MNVFEKYFESIKTEGALYNQIMADVDLDHAEVPSEIKHSKLEAWCTTMLHSAQNAQYDGKYGLFDPLFYHPKLQKFASQNHYDDKYTYLDLMFEWLSEGAFRLNKNQHNSMDKFIFNTLVKNAKHVFNILNANIKVMNAISEKLYKKAIKGATSRNFIIHNAVSVLDDYVLLLVRHKVALEKYLEYGFDRLIHPQDGDEITMEF